MSLQAVRDVLTSTTGWPACGDDDQVLDPQERLILALTIIPAGVVHVLTEDLERRNGTPLLLFRHIEIVDEQNELLTNWRSVDTFAPLVEATIKLILSLVGAGLS